MKSEECYKASLMNMTQTCICTRLLPSFVIIRRQFFFFLGHPESKGTGPEVDLKANRVQIPLMALNDRDTTVILEQPGIKQNSEALPIALEC